VKNFDQTPEPPGTRPVYGERGGISFGRQIGLRRGVEDLQAVHEQLSLLNPGWRKAASLAPPQHREAGSQNPLSSGLWLLPQASVMHRPGAALLNPSTIGRGSKYTHGFNLTIYNVKPVDHGQRAKWRLHFE